MRTLQHRTKNSISLTTIIVAVMTAVSGCASAPSPPPAPVQIPSTNDRLIVPGHRIGQVSLGMSVQQLIATLGTPMKSEPYAGGHKSSNTFSNGLLVDVAGTAVDGIFASDSTYKTAEGVKLGMSDLEVRALLGAPDKSMFVGDYDFRTCFKRGLYVNFGRSGASDLMTIRSILVSPPGCKIFP